MTRFLLLTAPKVALGYVALSLFVLALFAMPLWYGWQSNVEQGRAEILKEESQRLSEIFRDKGIAGVVTAIDDQVGTRHVGNRLLLLADSKLSRLSGNLSEWPRGVPPEPGNYKASIDLAGAKIPAILQYSKLPHGYHLLVGRNIDRFS